MPLSTGMPHLASLNNDCNSPEQLHCERRYRFLFNLLECTEFSIYSVVSKGVVSTIIVLISSWKSTLGCCFKKTIGMSFDMKFDVPSRVTLNVIVNKDLTKWKVTCKAVWATVLLEEGICKFIANRTSLTQVIKAQFWVKQNFSKFLVPLV